MVFDPLFGSDTPTWTSGLNPIVYFPWGDCHGPAAPGNPLAWRFSVVVPQTGFGHCIPYIRFLLYEMTGAGPALKVSKEGAMSVVATNPIEWVTSFDWLPVASTTCGGRFPQLPAPQMKVTVTGEAVP